MSAVSPFDVAGVFDAFVELDAGASLSGLVSADTDTSLTGSYEDSFTIEAYSVNGVLADISLGIYRVALRARVVGAEFPPSDVPVPATWTLLGLGAAAAWRARLSGKRMRRAA